LTWAFAAYKMPLSTTAARADDRKLRGFTSKFQSEDRAVWGIDR